MADGVVSQFDLIGHELVVDGFAGHGGASQGLGIAYREPDVAMNHNKVAIAVHRANHRSTRHYECDIFEVDPIVATRGLPVAAAWFSPDCRHHSKAAGGRPRSVRVRSLAWVVVDWAQKTMPRLILLENVEEFQDWGPLLTNGQPDPEHKGETFREWVQKLRDLGYVVEWRELVAADYGVPTIRKRLYVVARRDGQPITWPKPTHAKGGDGRLKPWRSASECIDWAIPNPSIFDRKRPLVRNTCRRIAKGAWRYVLTARDPCIVDGAAPYLTEHANACNQRTFSAQEPLRTQVAQVKGGHFALVCAFFEQANGGWYDGDGRSLFEPVSTICTSGANQRLVTAYFVKYYGNEREGVSLRDPLHTVTTKDRMGLVQCIQMPAGAMSEEQRAKAKRCADFLHEHLPDHVPACDAVMVGEMVLVDLTLRMLAPRELARAQGFSDDYDIEHGLFETFTGSGIYIRKRISKTEQVRGIGNSVCPPVAAALVAANLADLIAFYGVAA